MEQKKTAVVYCRANPGETRTMLGRLNTAMTYLQCNHMVAAGIVMDESDDRDVNRRGMEKIRSELRKTQADVLLMTSISQFGRIISDTGQFAREMEDHGVKLICADGSDFTSHLHTAMYDFFDSSREDDTPETRLLVDAMEAQIVYRDMVEQMATLLQLMSAVDSSET